MLDDRAAGLPRPSAANGMSLSRLLFDVGTVPAVSRRARAWTDALCEHYYPLELVTERENFHVGKLFVRDVAAIRMGQIECDAMQVHRRQDHIRHDTEEYFMLPFTTQSPLRLTQWGRESVLKPGDLGFVGTGSPYVYDQPERDRFTAIRIPAGLLRDRLTYVDDLTAIRFSSDNPTVGLFLDYVKSLMVHGDRLMDGRGVVLNCLLDLLVLAIDSPATASAGQESSVRAAHRRRALRYIDANLANRDLQTASIARALRLSPRYLQKIFGEQGESLGKIIRARRIAEARRLMSGPLSRNQSISQIAYSVGFDEVAHFSRAFRMEMDMSPTEFRDAAPR